MRRLLSTACNLSVLFKLPRLDLQKAFSLLSFRFSRIPIGQGRCAAVWVGPDQEIHCDLRDLVKAWQPQPSSSLGAEDSFRNLRSSEKKQAGLVSPPQLQAVSMKALNSRYADRYETVGIDTAQIHSIPVSQTIKSSIFDPRRATRQDTGLPGSEQQRRPPTA